MAGVKNVLKLRAQYEGGTPEEPEKYLDLLLLSKGARRTENAGAPMR